MTVAALFLSAANPAVAVMPAAGDGGERAQAAVRAAVAESSKVRAVDADDVARLIERAVASGISCDAARADCATRICAFGGLDFVVVTRVDHARATLALHDCADGREVRDASALLGAGDEERDAGIAALTHAVLGETEARGRLTVRAPAGVVVVDGAPGGAGGGAPLAFSLTAGPHEVEWRPRGADGGGAARKRTVEVPAAAAVEVAFADDAGPATAASSVSPATVLVAGVVAGGVVAAVGVAGALVVAPGERARYTAREYNDAVTLGRALFGVGVAGAVLAAVAGAAFVLVPAEPAS